MKKEASCSIKTSIGGQALMEGIMMRGPKRSAMAVRDPDGNMVIEEWDTEYSARNKFCKLPIIRGIFGFADSMKVGYKCIMRSAEISGLEALEEEEKRIKAEKKLAKQAKKQGKTVEELKAELEANAPEKVPETESVPAENGADIKKEDKKEKDSPMMAVMMALSVVFAVVLVVGLYILLPTFLYEGVMERFIPGFPQNNGYLQSVFEGVMRVLLLIGYMALMILIKDIRRTFQFHGAEHKTIFCYEAGLELTVENVKKQKRFHPRCGSSFLMLMLLVSILIGFLIPPTIHSILRVVIKILLIPLIMGIGYELIKLCGRHDNAFTRAVAAPGKWFQRITVLEPDDGMIECAIAAVVRVIPDDGSDKIN